MHDPTKLGAASSTMLTRIEGMSDRLVEKLFSINDQLYGLHKNLFGEKPQEEPKSDKPDIPVGRIYFLEGTLEKCEYLANKALSHLADLKSNF